MSSVEQAKKIRDMPDIDLIELLRTPNSLVSEENRLYAISEALARILTNNLPLKYNYRIK
jgi:hypothetical protein